MKNNFGNDVGGHLFPVSKQAHCVAPGRGSCFQELSVRSLRMNPINKISTDNTQRSDHIVFH